MQEPTRRDSGKADVDGRVRANKFHRSCRGNGDGMQAEGTRRNTGSPSGDRGVDQLATRERQAGPSGVAERLVVPMKPGNCRWREGASVERKRKKRQRTEGLVMSLTTHQVFRSCRRRCTTKRRNRPAFASTLCTTRCTEKDVLAFAYECCKANGGAAGVDGQTFEDIEEYGVERWLDELAQELKSRTYRPQPVRRV